MSQTIIHSTVRVACEVSFKVGNIDYGTIMVPTGTKVFRYVMDDGKMSDWWVDDEELDALCPAAFLKSDGTPGHFYRTDSWTYGISLPNANVGALRGPAKSYHQAHHY